MLLKNLFRSCSYLMFPFHATKCLVYLTYLVIDQCCQNDSNVEAWTSKLNCLLVGTSMFLHTGAIMINGAREHCTTKSQEEGMRIVPSRSIILFIVWVSQTIICGEQFGKLNQQCWHLAGWASSSLFIQMSMFRRHIIKLN